MGVGVLPSPQLGSAFPMQRPASEHSSGQSSQEQGNHGGSLPGGSAVKGSRLEGHGEREGLG
jgi:hypothetical protein